jgi:hypothetical protein
MSNATMRSTVASWGRPALGRRSRCDSFRRCHEFPRVPSVGRHLLHKARHALNGAGTCKRRGTGKPPVGAASCARNIEPEAKPSGYWQREIMQNIKSVRTGPLLPPSILCQPSKWPPFCAHDSCETESVSNLLWQPVLSGRQRRAQYLMRDASANATVAHGLA